MNDNIKSDITRALRVSFDPGGDKKAKYLVISLFLLSLTISILSVSQPLVFGILIDSIDTIGNKIPLVLIVIYAAIFFLSRTLKHLWLPLFTKYTLHIQRRISQNAYRHMLSLPSTYYLERSRHSFPKIISNATIGVHNILSVVLDNVAPIIFEITLAACIVGYIYGLDVMVVLFLGLVAFVLVTIVGSEIIRPHQRKYTDYNNKTFEILSEGLSNEDTVKLYSMRDILVKRHSDNLKLFENSCMKFFTGSALLQIGQVFCVIAFFVPVLYMGIEMVINNKISIGEFVVLNMYTVQFIMPLQQVAYAYRQIKEGAIDVEVLEEVLTAQVEKYTEGQCDHIGDGEMISIDFDKVSYINKNGGFRIKEVDIKIHPGETVALVGASGSGKSTLIRLLTRRIKHSKGKIQIGNCDIEFIGIDKLRKEIAVVSQDIVLFDDTLQFNILLGRKVTDKRMTEILKQVELDKFVGSQTKGIDATVGDRGYRLSGGERQRVGIARALVGNPSVLVFDESTSALDYETEYQVTKNIERAAIGITTIIVAHRLSTIRNVDNIFVISNGCVVESGKHEELIKHSGVYANMYACQRQKIEK